MKKLLVGIMTFFSLCSVGNEIEHLEKGDVFEFNTTNKIYLEAKKTSHWCGRGIFHYSRERFRRYIAENKQYRFEITFIHNGWVELDNLNKESVFRRITIPGNAHTFQELKARLKPCDEIRLKGADLSYRQSVEVF